ncbi:MAG: hypothetical protein JW722_07455 [Demequinaceae bacterium]|nr:hypothetical protein [Demequinaceae bacterium]
MTASESPSSSPKASMSPSVLTPSPEFTVIGVSTPGEVTVAPSLLEALPLPEGIWDEAGDGWVLAGYAPSASDVPAEHYVLYLVSPEGQRYQVLELDPDSGWQVLGWEGGESPALMVRRDDQGTTEWGFLDLDSGRMSIVDTGGIDWEYLLGVNAHGQYVTRGYDSVAGESTVQLRDRDFALVGTLPELGRLWSPGGLWWIPLDQSFGSGEMLNVMSLIDDERREVSLGFLADRRFCEGAGWVDDGHLLVVCQEAVYPESGGEGTSQGATFISISIEGGGGYEVIEEIVVSDRWFGPAVVADGAVVALGSVLLDGVGGNQRIELTVIREGVATRIPASAYGDNMWGPYPMTVVGSRVYVGWGFSGDAGDAPFLSVDDMAAGTSTVLIPLNIPSGGSWPFSAMVSCVIVGSHEAMFS